MKNFTWNNLTISEQTDVLTRPALPESDSIRDKTIEIIQRVRAEGDQTLFELTEKFDGPALTTLSVSAHEFADAQWRANETAVNAIAFAKNQLDQIHQAQIPRSSHLENSRGVICDRRARPIERVGLYIPGGSAPLISTVLMLAVPAKLANCPVRVLCTPPNKEGRIDPHLLIAAKMCDIHAVYKVGGAQAIAAMAYGTATIPKVDKIFGPGNQWVTQAKMLVAQDPLGASIDMPAGPSEVMVIADEHANPAFVAADLLAQAEHGADSQVILVTLSNAFAAQVDVALQEQQEQLPRIDIIKKSLAHSRVIIVEDIISAIKISNAYAPEHLILQIVDYQSYIPLIQNAGAVFLGKWSPETLGDYVTGSNHVLPTYGYARNCSGLSITDFMKFISFQSVSREGLLNIGPYAEILAEIEGLHAHKNAVSLRIKSDDNE